MAPWASPHTTKTSNQLPGAPLKHSKYSLSSPSAISWVETMTPWAASTALTPVTLLAAPAALCRAARAQGREGKGRVSKGEVSLLRSRQQTLEEAAGRGALYDSTAVGSSRSSPD